MLNISKKRFNKLFNVKNYTIKNTFTKINNTITNLNINTNVIAKKYSQKQRRQIQTQETHSIGFTNLLHNKTIKLRFHSPCRGLREGDFVPLQPPPLSPTTPHFPNKKTPNHL